MKANHKRWLKRVADYAERYGCFPHQDLCEFQIHHVVGRTGRHKKVEIGHWFILPVQWDFHDVSSNNPHNVTHWRRRYTDNYGLQSEQWLKMVNDILRDDGELPFGQDVIDSIMDTRK